MKNKILFSIHLTGALIIMATWIFPQIIWQTIGLALFVPTYIADIVMKKRITNFRWSKDKWLYIAFLVLVLMTPIWQVFTDSLSDHIYTRTLEKRLLLLLFGIVGLLGLDHRVKIRYFAYVMSAVSVALIIYLFAKVDWGYFSEQAAKRWVLAEVRQQYIASHLFFNLYLNTTLVLLFHTLSHDRLQRWVKTLLTAACCLIIGTLMTTEGRTGLLAMLAVSAVFLFCQLKSKAIRVSIVGFLIIIAATYAVLRFCQPAIIKDNNSRFALLVHTDRLFTPASTDNSRLAIWQNAWKVISRKPVLGYGVSKGRKVFVDTAVKDSNFYENYYQNMFLKAFPDEKDRYMAHPHNAFLDIWIQHGLPGLLTLAFIFIWPLPAAPKENRLSVFLFIIVYGLQAMFEVLGNALVIPALAFGLVLMMRPEKTLQ